MKMEQTECSETSAHKIQTPGNYPEENIQLTSCWLANSYSSLEQHGASEMFVLTCQLTWHHILL